MKYLKNLYASIENLFPCLILILSFSFFLAEAKAWNSPSSISGICNEKVPLINGSSFDNIVSDIPDNIYKFITCTGNISNEENLIDADLNTAASVDFTLGLGCDGTLSVKDTDDDFSAGTYAGFVVSASDLLQVTLATSITIRTYLNNSLQEEYDAVASLLDVNSSLVNNGQLTLGFITSEDFDEITIEYTSLLGVLASSSVFYAVVEEFCAGPTLACNEKASWKNTEYPLVINAENTGVSGVLCALCQVEDAEKVISPDDSDFATLEMTAGVGSKVSIALEDVLTTYTAGHFVGFDIENTGLVDATVFSGISIITYLDGVLQETSSISDLVSVNTSLLTGSGRQVVGFVTSNSFDQVKLEMTNLLGVSNNTKVYSAVIQNFCPVNLNCDTTYYTTQPDFPVIIENTRTGIKGVACVGCDVMNPDNVVSSDTTDYATIKITAGLLVTGSISIADVLTTYPAGSVAGLLVEDENELLELDLLNSLSICTYLDGVEQECRSGAFLLDLQVTLSWRSSGSGVYNLGFITSKPFDEIQLKVGSLASLLNTIRVYGAYIDTKFAYGDELNCCTDIFSFNCDYDGDGIINGIDIDDDNDGVADLLEDGGTGFDPLGDEDQDQILNYRDTDDPAFNNADRNNDGIIDAFDADGDGVPNYVDLESDNDGIPDLIEAGGLDTDNDGRIDSMKDSDGDGVPDAVDSSDPTCLLEDANGDNICDIFQTGTDTDNDGIQDTHDPDKDGDGLADIYDPSINTALPTPDTDQDGIADFADLDSDNDGITDLIEIGGIDTDGDGRIDAMLDQATGDTDNNGWADLIENNPLINMSLSDNNIDTDGDNFANHLDGDGDNDGIPDLIEAGGLDPNGDGLIDTSTAPWDADGDGLADIYDVNASDGSAGVGVNGAPLIKTTVDSNADGAVNTNTESLLAGGGGYNNINADADAVPNHLDLDSDNDGLLDVTEVGGIDANGDGMVDGSAFGTNGINNTIDVQDGNDPLIIASLDDVLDLNARLEYGVGGAANALADSDGDDVPDYLDVDADNDGVYDNYEAQLTIAYIPAVGVDADGDGVDASYDRDESAFGAALLAAAGGLVPYNHDLSLANTDDIPDYLDTDSDNDGICDRQEAWDNIYDGDSKADNLLVACTTGDNDGDGLLYCFDANDNDAHIFNWVGNPADDDGSTLGDNTTSTGTPFTVGTSLDKLLPDNGGSDDNEPDMRDPIIVDCMVPEVYYALTEQDEMTTTNFEYDSDTQLHQNSPTGVVRATTFCQPESDYYYFYNPLEPDNYLFALRNSDGSPNTVPMDELVDYIEIKIESNPADRWMIGPTQATLAMERDWNVVFKGTPTTGSTFDIKFYFQPEELARLDSITNAVVANSNGATADDLVWFKKPGGLLNSDISASGISNALDITSNDPLGVGNLVAGVLDGTAGSDVGNGRNYVEFKGLTSFSGGTATREVNYSSLPVELSSFTGKAIDCKVELNWTAESEDAFDYYEIQRSKDGRDFETIHLMTGLGGTSVRMDYDYVDKLVRRNNYYRLKMIDLDGSYEFSNVITVNSDCTSEHEILVFPNPIFKESAQTINVEFFSDEEETTFHLMDALGRRMKTIKISSKLDDWNMVQLNISDLPAGVFYLKKTEGRPFSKFVVQE